MVIRKSYKSIEKYNSTINERIAQGSVRNIIYGHIAPKYFQDKVESAKKIYGTNKTHASTKLVRFRRKLRMKRKLYNPH